jgi:flagellar protein FliT
VYALFVCNFEPNTESPAVLHPARPIALKFPQIAPLEQETRHSVRIFQVHGMSNQEVLAIYETLAGLTAQMAAAARAGDWDSLSRLEDQCASHSEAMAAGGPALTGELRARKVSLLKQIMANDRAVREVTEPWQAQLDRIMRPTH